jgi:hypothetical protein
MGYDGLGVIILVALPVLFLLVGSVQRTLILLRFADTALTVC